MPVKKRTTVENERAPERIDSNFNELEWLDGKTPMNQKRNKPKH